MNFLSRLIQLTTCIIKLFLWFAGLPLSIMSVQCGLCDKFSDDVRFAPMEQTHN